MTATVGRRPGAIEPGIDRAPRADPPSLSPRRERAWFLVAPFAISVLFSFAHTTDDALITLRYAWNVVHGAGPVFNLGEHVTGYSSPLHLVLSTAVVLAPHNWALVVAKVVSVGFGALTVWQGARLVQAVLPATWARRTGYLLLAGSCPLALSSANGLETTLYAFLVTLLLRRLVVADVDTRIVTTAIVAGLVVATRPDGALVVGALTVACLFVEPAAAGWARVRWALGGVVGLVMMLGSTWALTGSALPNTFYAKRMPVGRAVPQGIRYLGTTFVPGLQSGGLKWLTTLVLLAGMVGCLVVGVVVVLRRRARLACAVAVVVAQFGFALASGGDWMHGGRFVLAAIPALVVLALTGLSTIVDAGARRRPDLRRIAIVGGAGVLLAATLLPWTTQTAPIWRVHGMDDDAFVAAGGYGRYTAAWIALPRVIACIPGARSVATTEAGNAGWSDPDLRLLDLRGLTDDVIAHDAPAQDRTWAGVVVPDWWRSASVAGRRILERQPDAVLLLDEEGPMPSSALGGAYVKRGTVSLDSGSSLVVYTRRGLQPNCGL